MNVEIGKEELNDMVKSEISDCVHELLGWKRIRNGGWMRSGIPFETRCAIEVAVKNIISEEIKGMAREMVTSLTPNVLAKFLADEFADYIQRNEIESESDG